MILLVVLSKSRITWILLLRITYEIIALILVYLVEEIIIVVVIIKDRTIILLLFYIP
jgi:hypothetical protein